MKNLEESLKKLVDDFYGDASIVVQDIKTGEAIGINNDRAFYVASVIKMWLLWLFLLEEQDGKRDLKAKTVLTIDPKVVNMGITELMAKGHEWTWEELLTLMVVLSDNHATNHIIEALTLEKVNAEIQRHNVQDTVFNKKMNAATANWATADDVAKMFELLYTSPELSEKNREIVKYMMANQKFNTKLPLKFKPKLAEHGNVFYHKTGEIALAEVDAGILSMPSQNKDIIIVAMTKDLKDNLDGIDFINKVGELVYNYFNK